MCLDLTYVNSESYGLVEFAYLAVGDDTIINKSVVEKDPDTGEPYIESHGGRYDTHLWLQWCDAEDREVLTALLSYHDIDGWEGSLCQALTFLHNNDLKDDLVSNIRDMFSDAVHDSGFCSTLIEDLINSALSNAETISWRTVDFQMHEPSPDDLHPHYDT
jgi:hypothetical protein